MKLVTILAFGLGILPLELGLADPVVPIRIVVLGDSIAEGFGLPVQEAFPVVLEGLLRSGGFPQVEVTNSGVGGSTSASGPARIKWHLKTRVDLFILELGGNDGLRGLSAQEMKKNLALAIDEALAAKAAVLLTGMKVPTSYGSPYGKNFEKAFVELSKEKKVAFVPFVLEGVGGSSSLNQADGIHPNSEGQKKIAKLLLPHVLSILKKQVQP